MASQLPDLQQALVQASTPGVFEITQTRPLPKLSANQVLVQIAAVAVSPSDWKIATHFPCPGAGTGSDFAGTVIQLGPDLIPATSSVKVGDRVAGAIFGSNPLEPQAGAFAEFMAISADLIWRLPNSMGFPDAASIGLSSVGTVGLAAFHERHLNLPGSPERPFSGGAAGMAPWVLVYGGSTASGTVAIQILKLCEPTPLLACPSTHWHQRR